MALSDLGHECVFACEIDDALRRLYEENFKVVPEGDIRSISVEEIPPHEILTAGFPCQPFSKAGEQEGFECPQWGDLFEFVIRVIEANRPEYFILENVPNIKRHNGGETWKAILTKLRTPEWGYEVRTGKLSPHDFGIPQIRERVFLVGSLNGLQGFRWPEGNGKKPSLGRLLSRKVVKERSLPEHYIEVLDVWQDFLDRFPSDRKLPSFPIWSMEFGATYPFEETTPYVLLQSSAGRKKLRECFGSHGTPLAGLSKEPLLEAVPSYARTRQTRFPKWKRRFIRQNRELCEDLLPWINDWIPKILPFPASLQKLEWNYKGGERVIWKHVIQIRASGVRVKRPTTAPSLVAMTNTQIPIVGGSRDKIRFMTMRECARLQSMGGLKHLPASETRAVKALGNAVNVEVVKRLAQNLLEANASNSKADDETSNSPFVTEFNE